MSSVNIQTAIKIRPLIDREKREKLEPSWVVQNNNSIVQVDSAQNFIGEPYSFDHIFDDTKSNKDIYDAVVQPLVMSCFEGINSTIFAYGQTSSGKTHTMIGTKDIPGIISYAVKDIFSYIQENNSLNKFLLRCSYLEIYNEKINDLLDTNATDIKIREGFDGVYVIAKEEVVREPNDLFLLMKKGLKTRKIGCTDMNERSSRSHTIFKLLIQSQDKNSEGSYVESTLNLVDLAGSERVGQMNLVKERQLEGVSINKSLTSLGLVIRKLSENDQFINYRDSKLTRLLQHSLGGNSRTLIIANITMAALEETKSTLEFAQRAKYVKNQPIRNEKVTDKDQLKQYEHLCEDYKKQIERLRLEKLEREETINALEGKISNIKLFSTDEKKIKPPNRRHTFAFKPEKNLFSIKEPEESNEEFDEDFFKLISPAKSELLLPVTNMEDKENISFEETCLSPPNKLARPNTPKTPYSILKSEKQHLEESYESLKAFTNYESQIGFNDQINEFKELVDNLRQENLDLKYNNEILMKKLEGILDIQEKLFLLKSILEVKPLQDTQRNALNTIFEEEIDLFNGEVDSTVNSENSEHITSEINKICATIIKENKDLKWQLNEKERIINGLKHDYNTDKAAIETAFMKLKKNNEDLLKENENINKENEKLKYKIIKEKELKECELEMLNNKIKKLTDYKQEMHKKLSELTQENKESTELNVEDWQNLRKELYEIKFLKENLEFKNKELEEQICLFKNEINEKGKHIISLNQLQKVKEDQIIEKTILNEQLKTDLEDALFSLSGEQKELEKVSQELEEKTQYIQILEKRAEEYLRKCKILETDHIESINKKNKKIEEDIRKIVELEEKVFKKEETVMNLQKTIAEMKQNNYQFELKQTKEQLEILSLELKEKNVNLQKLAELETKLSEYKLMENHITEKDDTILSLQKTIENNELDFSSQLQEKREQLKNNSQKLDELEILLSKNEIELLKKEETITMLQKKIEHIDQNEDIESYQKELTTIREQFTLELQAKTKELEEKSQFEAQNLKKLDELCKDLCKKEETIESLHKTIENINIENINNKLLKENLEFKVKELEEQICLFKNEIIEKEQLIKSLNELQKTKEDQINENTVLNEQLKTDLEDALFSLSGEQKELEKVTKELEEKTQYIQTLEKRAEEYLRKCKILEKDQIESINEKNKKIEEDVRKIVELEEKVLKKDETVTNLQKIIAEMKQNKEIKNYQFELKQTKEQLEILSLELNEKNVKLEKLSELESKLFEYKRMENHINEKDDTILSLEKTVENYQLDLKTAKNQLKEKCEELEKTSQKLDKLEVTFSKNQIELLKKEKTIEMLQKKMEHIDQNEDIESCQKELITIREQFTLELQAKTKELEEKSQLGAQNLKKLDELCKDLCKKEETIKSLNKTIENINIENINNKLFKENLEFKVKELEEQISIERKELEKVTKELEEKSQYIQTLEKQAEEYLERCKILEKAQIESINEKNKKIEEEVRKIVDLEEKVLKKDETVANLQKTIAEMKQNKEIKNYQFELKQTNEQLEILSLKLKEKNVNLQKLAELETKLSEYKLMENHITEKDDTILSLQKTIENYQLDLKTTKNQLNTFSSQLQEKHEQLEKTSQKLDKLEVTLSKNQIELLKKEKTIEMLQKKLERIDQNQDIENYQKELTSIREQFSLELQGKTKQLAEKSQVEAQNLKKLDELCKDLCKKEETIKSLHKRIENINIEDKLSDYEAQKENWKALNKELSEIESFQKTKNASKSNDLIFKITQLKSHSITLQTNLDNKITQCEKLLNENNDLKKQLAKLKGNLLNKSMETEKLIEQNQKITQNTSTTSHFKIFDEDSTDQIDEMRTLKQDLKEKLFEINKLNEDKSKLLENIETLENSLREEKYKLKQRSEDFFRMKDKSQSLELQMIRLKKDLVSKEQELAKEKEWRMKNGPPERPKRLSDEGRMSPSDLRRVKRQSIHDQRRGLGSGFANLFDSDDYTVLQNEHNEVDPPQKVDKETQATCDIHQKYKNMKKVALQRKEENNYLRQKLDIPPDIPVLPRDIQRCRAPSSSNV